jgi:Secretion system C-terminal sorting domain
MFAQPTTNAPIPTRLQSDVVAVFSNTYTQVGTDFNPNWGQSGFGAANVAFNPTGTGSNVVLAYTNFNYQGNILTSQNLTTGPMEKLHIDVWTANCTSFKVYLVSSNDGERTVTVTPTLNGWSSFDINLSDYSSQNFPLTSIKELKYESGAPGTSAVYIDNVYFWKTPPPVGTPLYGTFTIPAKENGDVAFAITPPTSTSPAPFTYSSSNTAVATLSGSNINIIGVGTSIITASQVASTPNLAGSTAANFVVGPRSVPNIAAPTPPTRAAVDVVSIFSNAYSNINIAELPTGWSHIGQFSTIQVAANDIWKISNCDFFALQINNSGIDLSAMEKVHIDYWTANNSDVSVKLVRTGGTEAISSLGTTVTGSWRSVDLDLSSFNVNRTNIHQLLIYRQVPSDIYIDNFYFWRIPLSTQNFSALNIKMYPNPATNVLNIEALNEIENISVYNLLGQEVISKTTNNKVVNLDITSINSGIYIIKTTIDGVVSASRFVKE